MPKYASETNVSAEKTFMEIRALLKKYGGTNFVLIENEERFGIAFEYPRRRVRFVVPMPSRDDAYTPGYSNQYSSQSAGYSEAKHEQLIRQRWRAAFLVIKAKLESVDTGIETFDEAFMAQLVLPSGATAAEWFIPQYRSAIQTGEMPPLLPSG